MSKPDWAVGQQCDQPGDRDRRLRICDRPSESESDEPDVGSGGHDVGGGGVGGDGGDEPDGDGGDRADNSQKSVASHQDQRVD